jgi:hypothetical protein
MDVGERVSAGCCWVRDLSRVRHDQMVNGGNRHILLEALSPTNATRTTTGGVTPLFVYLQVTILFNTFLDFLRISKSSRRVTLRNARESTWKAWAARATRRNHSSRFFRVRTSTPRFPWISPSQSLRQDTRTPWSLGWCPDAREISHYADRWQGGLSQLIPKAHRPLRKNANIYFLSLMGVDVSVVVAECSELVRVCGLSLCTCAQGPRYPSSCRARCAYRKGSSNSCPYPRTLEGNSVDSPWLGGGPSGPQPHG